jgi:type III pantothenate kinase
MPSSSWIAVDVGNARIKLGWFAGDAAAELPEPSSTFRLDGRQPELPAVLPWLEEVAATEACWWIGSVNRPATTRLIDWLRQHRRADPVTILAAGDLPLEVRLPRPDMVGIDRLLDAVAANRLRSPGRPAVVVDVGTAITVDLISPEGAFLGGAILPGIGMAARAMHEFTDLLPLMRMSELNTPPPPLGTATTEAMRSGLFYGAVGAIRELIDQLAGGQRATHDSGGTSVPPATSRGTGVSPLTAGGTGVSPVQPGHRPEVFLTGGAGPAVAELIGRGVRHVPHLTLAGIALTARGSSPET